MAALMIKVPQETARVLQEIPVPGKPEDQASSHITVMYLGKDLPIEAIGEMLPAIHEVTSKTKPFAVTTTKVTTFPAGDDGVPVIAPIESPPLHAFRQALCDAFEEADLKFDKKFPDYKPHATLAYAPDPETKVNMEIPELTWGVSELVLWGSNRGEGRLVVRFPLSLAAGKTAGYGNDRSVLYRALVKLSAWSLKDSYV